MEFIFGTLQVGQVREAVIKMNCAYDPREGQGDYPPVMKNVYISNVTSEKSQYGLSLIGLEGENCIENVVITDCNFSGVDQRKQSGECEKP